MIGKIPADEQVFTFAFQHETQMPNCMAMRGNRGHPCGDVLAHIEHVQFVLKRANMCFKAFVAGKIPVFEF